MPLESQRFPYIPIEIDILGLRGRRIAIEALIDTGFDGGVVIPADTLDPELVPDTISVWRLPNGDRVHVPTYDAVVHVGELGIVSAAVIALGSEALVGRRVTDQYRIVLDHGNRVIVEP